jgi:ABC-type Fe3+-siderophore transport system permease subunit
MHSTERSNAKIFLDHLYFSVCCVLVGFILVYSIARWTAHGFDLDDYILVCVSAIAALSLILAIIFTYISISKRPSDFIVRTKRQR